MSEIQKKTSFIWQKVEHRLSVLSDEFVYDIVWYKQKALFVLKESNEEIC